MMVRVDPGLIQMRSTSGGSAVALVLLAHRWGLGVHSDSEPPVLQFLGLHLHSDDVSGMNHAHDDHEEGPPDYIYKMLVVVGGIYAFYLMETIFSLISNSHEHHHHEVRKTPGSSPHTLLSFEGQGCCPSAQRRI